MKKNIVKIGLIFSAIGVASLLTGCGSSSPEDVAKEYVSSSAKGNLTELINSSANYELKDLERIKKRCIFKNNLKVKEDIYLLLNDVYQDAEVSKLSIELDKFMSNDKELKEKGKKLIENDDKEALLTFLMKAADDNNAELVAAISKINDKNKYGEKYNKRDEVENTAALILLMNKNRQRGFKRSIENIVPIKFKDTKPSQECVDKNLNTYDISKINTIEVTSKSPDKSTVSLETIDSKDKSRKMDIRVEKINDKWKVVSSDR